MRRFILPNRSIKGTGVHVNSHKPRGPKHADNHRERTISASSSSSGSSEGITSDFETLGLNSRKNYTKKDILDFKKRGAPKGSSKDEILAYNTACNNLLQNFEVKGRQV